MSILEVSLYEIFKVRRSQREIPFIMELFSYVLVAFLTMNNYTSSNLIITVDYIRLLEDINVSLNHLKIVLKRLNLELMMYSRIQGVEMLICLLRG